MYGMTRFEKSEIWAMWHLSWQVAKMPQNSQNIDFQTPIPRASLMCLKFPFQRCIIWPLLRKLISDLSVHLAENSILQKLLIKKFAQHLPGCMKLISGP